MTLSPRIARYWRATLSSRFFTANGAQIHRPLSWDCAREIFPSPSPLLRIPACSPNEAGAGLRTPLSPQTGKVFEERAAWPVLQAELSHAT
eukprot:6501935-Pyramimonas_sp.AAC.1